MIVHQVDGILNKFYVVLALFTQHEHPHHRLEISHLAFARRILHSEEWSSKLDLRSRSFEHTSVPCCWIGKPNILSAVDIFWYSLHLDPSFENFFGCSFTIYLLGARIHCAATTQSICDNEGKIEATESRRLLEIDMEDRVHLIRIG